MADFSSSRLKTFIEIEDRRFEEETVDVRLLETFPVAKEVVSNRAQDLTTGREAVGVAERLEGSGRYLESVEVDEVTSDLAKVEPTDERIRPFRLLDALAVHLFLEFHVEHQRTGDGMYAFLKREVALDGSEEILRVLDEAAH